MQDGDISSGLGPRVIVVAHPLVVNMPDARRRKADYYKLLGRWKKYVNCFEWDDEQTTRLRDLTWRGGVNVTLVAFLPDACWEHFTDAADRHHIGAKVELFPTAGHLARALAYMPEVIYIVTNHPALGLAFGPRTVHSLEEVR